MLWSFSYKRISQNRKAALLHTFLLTFSQQPNTFIKQKKKIDRFQRKPQRSITDLKQKFIRNQSNTNKTLTAKKKALNPKQQSIE